MKSLFLRFSFLGLMILFVVGSFGAIPPASQRVDNTDYKPDAEFDGVYVALAHRAWRELSRLKIPASKKKLGNYRVMVEEESSFYRVTFYPKPDGSLTLGSGNSRGIEVMFIFDKKTLRLKFRFSPG